jgi:hypothetical protein
MNLELIWPLLLIFSVVLEFLCPQLGFQRAATEIS